MTTERRCVTVVNKNSVSPKNDSLVKLNNQVKHLFQYNDVSLKNEMKTGQTIYEEGRNFSI